MEEKLYIKESQDRLKSHSDIICKFKEMQRLYKTVQNYSHAKNSITVNVKSTSPRRMAAFGWKKIQHCGWTNKQVVFLRKALRQTASWDEQGGDSPALTLFT